MKADIVIFDLKKIKDNTTDTKFNVHPSGVTYVMINGTLVIEKSKLTGERPGKIIKS
jgi:N-acyl-D-aspartate/D-glutamate deacylase